VSIVLQIDFILTVCINIINDNVIFRDKKFVESFPDSKFDQSQFKNFWKRNQKYRTICMACISKRADAARKSCLNNDVRDVNHNNSTDYPNWGGVRLDTASKAILMNWYNTAQGRVFGENGKRRQRVNIDISDDEDDKPDYAWARKPVSFDETSHKIAVTWLQDARAKLQRKRGWESDIEKFEFKNDKTFRN